MKPTTRIATAIVPAIVVCLVLGIPPAITALLVLLGCVTAYLLNYQDKKE